MTFLFGEGSMWAPFWGHVGHHVEDRRHSKNHQKPAGFQWIFMVWGVQFGVIFLCFWGVCFKIVFWSSWGRFWGRFGDHFGIIIGPKSKKKRDWFWDRFSVPRLSQMAPYSRAGGALGGPLICARFQQEKMKRLELNKKRRPKQEKGSTVLIIVQIIVGFCVSQARDLTRLGQGPANCWNVER